MTQFKDNQYNPPGVYVEEVPPPASNAVASNVPSLLALVGPSVAYRTYSEAVVLSGETPVQLSKLGIDTTTVVVTNESGTPYVLDTDYELVTAAGEDQDAGETLDNPTTINRIGAGGITDNAVVYVHYRFTDAEQFAAQTFTDPDDVIDFFGPAFEDDGVTIKSPLTLAATVALANQSAAVVCVSSREADEGDRPAGWTGPFTTQPLLAAAYNQIVNDPRISVVVPISAGMNASTDAVGTDLLTSINASVVNGLRRTGVIGAERLSAESGTTVAGAIDSERVLLAWPPAVNYFNPQKSVSVEVGGIYLAAALGAMLTSRRPQVPLTRKRVRGFSSIPSAVLNTLTRSAKDALSSGGVTVIEPDFNQNLVVRHGVTTKVGTIHDREISLTRSQDVLVNRLLNTFSDSGLIGGPLTLTSLISLKATAIGVLESLVQQGVIDNYQNLRVRSLGVDPSVVEVKFEYKPIYPLNYIIIRFGINTETGLIVDAQAA